MKKTPEYNAGLIAMAKRALHGLDDAHIFVGVMVPPTETSVESIEFQLQLGHCVLMNKPIIIPAPFGYELPPKLALVADRIVRFDPNRMETLQQNLAVVVAEMGIVKQ